MSRAPLVPIDLAPQQVSCTRHADGGLTLRSPLRLAPYARCVGDWLEHWAEATPTQVLFSERAPGGWRRVTYAEAAAAARAIGQALIERDLSTQRPLVVLSGNGIDAGLILLGGMHAGIPVVPVSTAYSLVSRDYAQLRHILEIVTPGAVYADDGARFAPAIAAAGIAHDRLIVSQNPAGPRVTSFASLHRTPPGTAWERAFAAIRPDSVGKILFTSGSTDLPKGVINTHRMMCSNQEAFAQLFPVLSRRPPVLVDWLPWNHTFGGNFCTNMVLRHGGTLTIDEGKPMPGLIDRTVANLKEVSPTAYFNVPRGYDLLVGQLEADAELRGRFFRDLDFLFSAGAALPVTIWNRLEAMSVAARGRRVLLSSGWGATETAPDVTAVHFDADRPSCIGLPLPGCELRLAPVGGKLELRARGPNVTPGYYKRDDLTAKAFDADGWYCMGDAGRLLDENEPAKGIEFDGRIAEDFKLTSGTWVHVGTLRLKVIAAGAPLIQDVVLTGHDRDDIGLLVFPNEAACRALCPDHAAGTPLAAVLADPRVRGHILAALERLAAEATGSSQSPRRAMLLTEPPAIDANEITDKGYINQGAVLARRGALVERLYEQPVSADVLIIPGR